MHFGPDGDLHASLECSQTHCLSTYSPRTDMSYGERWAWLTFAYPFVFERSVMLCSAPLNTAPLGTAQHRSAPLGSSRAYAGLAPREHSICHHCELVRAKKGISIAVPRRAQRSWLAPGRRAQ